VSTNQNSSSNLEDHWLQGKNRSDYHFDWQRKEAAGHDYKWLGRYSGNWHEELDVVLENAQKKAYSHTWHGELDVINHMAQQKTWIERNKIAENQPDRVRAGHMTDFSSPTFRRYKQFDGVFADMIDFLGLEKRKQAFHIQHPGEMLNLHVDKQYEVDDDPTRVARFFIFLEDWKPGHFLQMGTSFVQWKKGDIINFDWMNMPHSSANAGWEPRCLIQVTGVITRKTEEVLMGKHKWINL
jgi:hypothetical protein